MTSTYLDKPKRTELEAAADDIIARIRAAMALPEAADPSRSGAFLISIQDEMEAIALAAINAAIAKSGR